MEKKVYSISSDQLNPTVSMCCTIVYVKIKTLISSNGRLVQLNTFSGVG